MGRTERTKEANRPSAKDEETRRRMRRQRKRDTKPELIVRRVIRARWGTHTGSHQRHSRDDLTSRTSDESG